LSDAPYLCPVLSYVCGAGAIFLTTQGEGVA
jgi:hypothetical protein